MSYQTLALVYGQTFGEDDYQLWEDKLWERFKNGEGWEFLEEYNSKEEMLEDVEELGDFEEFTYEIGLFQNFKYKITRWNGYYHDIWKIGIVIEEDEVRTMQNIVFDIVDFKNLDLKKLIEDNKEIIEFLELDVDKFSLGFCTDNY